MMLEDILRFNIRDAPIIHIGRFADNRHRPISMLVSAKYHLHSC